MNVTRRDFIRLLAAAGLLTTVSPRRVLARLTEMDAAQLYDHDAFGNVTLLTTGDLHGQMSPHYLMEAVTLLAPDNLAHQPGYLAGSEFLSYYGMQPGTLEGYLMSSVDFPVLVEKYGKIGGAAYLTALIRRQRELLGEERVLTFDAGDTWVTSGLTLLTEGQVAVDWMNASGYDYMVAHWEFTLGRERFDRHLQSLNAKFLSFNIVDDLFGDRIYEPYEIRRVNGRSLGIIGSSFPYVRVAHPPEFTEGLSFGVRDHILQEVVDEVRAKGVDAVILLSHNGLPLDTALGERIKGIDLIISAHTHDITPQVLESGPTRIVSVGSGGKFLGRIDLDVGRGRLEGVRLHLLPVLPGLLKADPEVTRIVTQARTKHERRLGEVLGKTDTLLYKRDTIFSTVDRLIGMAVEAAHPGVDIVFSPGYRWGTTLLPGEEITFEKILSFTGITYPELYLFTMKGSQIRQILEDLGANVFEPNPFYQQGGDFTRLYGASFDIKINAGQGERIRNLHIRGKPVEPEQEYLCATYGGMLQNAGTLVEGHEPRPIYDILAEFIRREGTVKVDTKPDVRILDGALRTVEDL